MTHEMPEPEYIQFRMSLDELLTKYLGEIQMSTGSASFCKFDIMDLIQGAYSAGYTAAQFDVGRKTTEALMAKDALLRDVLLNRD